MIPPEKFGLSVEQFERTHPASATERLRGVVKSGTHLRFVKMTFKANIENGNSIEADMLIMDGAFSGKTVLVDWVSRKSNPGAVPQIDHSFMDAAPR